MEIAPVPVNTLSRINKKSTGESTILSYLDFIQDIINNPNNTPEKAQSLIENSWINILMEQPLSLLPLRPCHGSEGLLRRAEVVMKTAKIMVNLGIPIT
jgi:hypothetical protein